MRKFYDVCHGREISGSDKKAWTKLGSMMEDDGRFSVVFDYVPPTGEWCSIFPRDKKKESGDIM